MNITRENLGDLDLSIKIEVVESDYAERVTKQLKKYQHQASVPGFRKGMAPKALIERMYKPSVVADEVNNILSESLYKYIDDEKLNIIGSPLANDEKTGNVDFAGAKDYTFYFDAALAPNFEIKWDAIDTKLMQVKISSKEADKQVEEIRERYGKFETPEETNEQSMVYGKVEELDKAGNVVEGGKSTYVNFKLEVVKEESRAAFMGKKAQEKVVFNPKKAFGTAEMQNILHLSDEEAKAFKADVEFTLSGCSNITPAELNEEFFEKMFPGQGIKDEAAFKKAVSKEMEKANNEQCQIIYCNQVRDALIKAFDAPMPEAFLKRWILSRGEKDITAESLEANWNEKYVPGLKNEFIESELNKIKFLEPKMDEIVAYVKNILATGAKPEEGETEEEMNKRLDESARTIAQDRNNMRQIIDKLYQDNLFALLNDKLKPEVEKVSLKELAERVK